MQSRWGTFSWGETFLMGTNRHISYGTDGQTFSRRGLTDGHLTEIWDGKPSDMFRWVPHLKNSQLIKISKTGPVE